MQCAKLFAYVNNIHKSHGRRYKAYSAGQTVPSTAQIRAEGINTKCVGKKRFNGNVTHGLRKEHVLPSPLILDKVRSYMQIISHDTLR